jgi:DNA modification methylase
MSPNPPPLILQGDARNLPIADASVDLIVTSPPYFGQRSYQDGGEHYEGQIGDESSPYDFLDALLEATAEMVRVLKPSGSIWVNLGDKYCSPGGHTDTGASTRLQGRPNLRKQGRPDRSTTGHGVKPKSLFGLPWRYAIQCIDELGLILRAEVIWDKPNGLPESVTDRVRRSHEQWFHFTRQPRYFSAVDEIREAYEAKPQRRFSPRSTDRTPRPDGQSPRTPHIQYYDTPSAGDNPLGKLPGSVWEIPTQPLAVPAHLGIDHFAAFPLEWPRRIIKGWCPEAGTVLDPFGGTGTTALVARALGRNAISVDLSRDYCRLAQWRTTDPGEIARAMQVEKPPEIPDGMDSLLDLLEDGAA